jgi:predicted O-methyltransferase YrrM
MSLSYSLPTIKISSRWPKQSRNYMLPMEQGYLLTMLDNIKPKRMIEFGVNEGLTASAILEWIKSIEYYLGVDVPFGHKMPLPGQQSEVPQEAGHLVESDARFELFLREGYDDTPIIEKGPFDVAFIDGDHSRNGVVRDIELSQKILVPNGWIFWHDYNNKTVEVSAVLEELQQGGRGIINIEGTMLAYEQL